ncbi:MAG: diacylglycerol kinase, partial [Actinomycetota bacterium]|nr:diacylglycerol kinase [Actinomycetota bacterium]
MGVASEQGRERRRLLVVTNDSAGSADGLADALAVLEPAADVRVAECRAPSELDGIVAARDGRELVVAGGDGSLHNVVRTLRDRGELTPDDPLGLLPLGTGNDLSRTTGIPLPPAAAAEVVLSGRARPLDLLLDDAGGVVVNVVHLGVGAEAAAAASELKPRLGALAYPVGAVAAAARTGGWRLRVEVDGTPLWDGEEPLLMLAVANGRFIGGGTPLAPEADPGDGLADVLVSAAVGLLDRMSYAVDLRGGEHPERDDVR